LAGAVALFYRKRLAWVASLVGAGALACAFAAIWVSMARFYVHPIDEELKLLRGMDVSAGSVIALGVLFALFALCLALFIGLLWTRKDFRPI
jgi:stage V sporulation protein SpoVS